MAISNCSLSPTSENPPTLRCGRSDFQFGAYLQKLSANPRNYS